MDLKTVAYIVLAIIFLLFLIVPYFSNIMNFGKTNIEKVDDIQTQIEEAGQSYHMENIKGLALVSV